jgi:hypothetical protein
MLYHMRQKVPRILALVLAPLLIACGNGPQLDTSVAKDIFAENRNPVGLLEARFANDSNTAQFGQRLGYEYHAHIYCTAFLRDDGMILTESECLFNQKRRKTVDNGEMRVYFRRPTDTATEEVKIKRTVIASRAFNKNWTVLEPDNRHALLAKYGGLSLKSHLETLAEGETTQETRIVFVVPPNSSGEARIAVNYGTIEMDMQLESEILRRANEIRRTAASTSVIPLSIEDATRLAREQVTADATAALANAPRVDMRVRDPIEFSSAGGLVLKDGVVIAIMGRSNNKAKDRRESAARVGNLPF